MTRTATPLDPSVVAALRRTLLVQRDFRRDQLAQLDRQRSGRTLSGAHREIYVSLAVGARTALQDAEAALWRIDHDRFGRCVTCAADLDLEVLQTLPQTARCLPCQRAALDADGRADDRPDPQLRV